VLVVHGGPGLSAQSLAGLDVLARPGRRLVGYDQRGAGGSSRPADGNYRLEAHLADLDAVRVWAGAERVALVGASWGGLVAAAYAARYPERVTALVLLDAAPLDFAEFLAGQQRFSERVAQLQRAGLVPDPVPADRDDSCLPSLTALLPAYLGNPNRPPPPGITGGTCTASTAQATYGALRDRGGLGDLGTALARFPGRALVIAGQRDPFGLGWQRRNLQLPAASRPDSLIVADAGHIAFAERPGRAAGGGKPDGGRAFGAGPGGTGCAAGEARETGPENQ
jgi:pimeloyl-ACP methyl ester carboxylesterase